MLGLHSYGKSPSTSSNKSNKAMVGTGCIASFNELNSSMHWNKQSLSNDCVFGFQLISTKQR
jgi:hypothetical protein